MSNSAKYFFLALLINFVVLASLSMLFEYFDETGDDPIYCTREAIKNFLNALVISGVIVFTYKKRSGQNGEQS